MRDVFSWVGDFFVYMSVIIVVEEWIYGIFNGKYKSKVIIRLFCLVGCISENSWCWGVVVLCKDKEDYYCCGYGYDSEDKYEFVV